MRSSLKREAIVAHAQAHAAKIVALKEEVVRAADERVAFMEDAPWPTDPHGAMLWEELTARRLTEAVTALRKAEGEKPI